MEVGSLDRKKRLRSPARNPAHDSDRTVDAPARVLRLLRAGLRRLPARHAGRYGEYELTDAVDLLVSAGRRVGTVPLEGWCRNVNTPTDVEWVDGRLDGT